MAKRGRKAAKRTTAPKRAKPIRKPKSVRAKSPPKTARSKAARAKPGRLKSAPSKSGKRAVAKPRSKSETAGLKNQLRIAQERQTASAEILRTIGSVSGDAERSLFEIAEITKRLFEASSVSIFVAEGDKWGQIVHDGASSKRIGAEVPVDQLRIGGHSLPGATFSENRQIHLPDIDNVDPAIADWPGLRPSRAAGTRTLLGAPLRRAGHAIGVLIVHRNRLAPFADDELTLLQSFADQAAIAIHNARLFNETQEALERQTATADILKVIASSPDDVQPVFDAIVTNAVRLVGAFSAGVYRFVDGMVHLAAFTSTNPAGDQALRDSFPRPLAQTEQFKRAYDGKAPAITDTEDQPDQSLTKLARARGFRSLSHTPLMGKGKSIGTIVVSRRNPGPFSAHHVQLLQTFADQAVIAIENVRLFNETREALERQTATADILKVIASSPDDVQPVFEAIAASATRLIDGFSTGVYRFVDGIVHLAAFTAVNPASDEMLKSRFPRPIEDGDHFSRAYAGEVVAITDIEAQPLVRLKELARVRGFRSLLHAPLKSKEGSIGVIAVSRQTPGTFSAHHVQLLQTFADQAVIAIENVRLFNETQEALEQQTAISDVLRVISSSPGDVRPVFASVAEHAARICEAEIVDILTIVDDRLQYAAEFGEFGRLQPGETAPLNRDSVMGRSICDKQPVHVVDLQSTDHDFPLGREYALALGHRTTLAVPLIREDCALGTILVRRREVRPFDDRHVALLKTFADQAAIAIENARLINETREALERQTATADILKVIASSPDDVRPVFDAIAASANGLLGGFSTAVFRFVDDIAHLAAFTPANPAADSVLQSSFPMPLTDYEPFELAKTGQPTEITDTEQMPNLRVQEIARLRGFRSMLFVPLMSGESPIGLISVTRTETGSFAEHHVKLLQTFADQAVIAISNVQLFQQVQAKTTDLQESLQQQTATADVLKVISRSAFDLQPVLDTLVGSAAQLCGADAGIIWLRKDDLFHAAAASGFSPQDMAFFRDNPRSIHDKSLAPRVLRSRRTVHIPDRSLDPEFAFPGMSSLPSTMLGVPLLRDDRIEGVFTLTRLNVAPFGPRQIELVESYADQAVIAIENARLFNEVQAKTRELAASLEDLRAAQDRLVQTEKLASLGQLTAGIAHEIKNPLNFVNNFSALSAELTDELNDALRPVALDDKVRKEVEELTGLLKDNLEKVVQHGKRADSIVKNMLLHSREGSGEQRPADINTLLDESLNLAYHGARAEKSAFNITLHRDFDAKAGEVELFPQEITRAFLNFISNGFYAATRRKAENGDPGFEPLLAAVTRNLGDSVEIRIRDNGTGIPAEVREKMFNPFFTTKPAGEGTGLGLSMSHDIIVKQHGGSIDVETEPGQFTEMRITLPRRGRR
jgi:two-component system, NtrC family, sensor kinase